MKKVLRRRPSAAMIVALVALIAALAGTAIAGGGFITKKKFNNRINSLNTAISTKVGGPITYVTTTTPSPTPSPTNGTPVTATCPAGTHVTGGGIKVGNEANSFVNDSYPTTTGWTGHVYTNTAADTATTTAICAVASVSGSAPGS